LDSDNGGTSSNVTGTDNESSVDGHLITARLSSKVVFRNSAGEYLSVYRCVLQGKVRQVVYCMMGEKTLKKIIVF